MPADTNQYGDIFGGWLLGQMDIAGGIFAAGIAKGRTATVAVDAMTFRNPVSVGDVMCIYTDLIRIGNTSVTVHVEAWVIRRNQTDRLLVTDGNFTYVALDDERRPRPIEHRRLRQEDERPLGVLAGARRTHTALTRLEQQTNSPSSKRGVLWVRVQFAR
jgi:acyl-CoA thioesterase YciA